MAEYGFEIGVVVARKKLASPWADHAWTPHAVLAGAPAVKPGTPLGVVGDAELFYAGSLGLTLQSSQTAHYRDNLASGRPSLWVSLRLDPVAGHAPARVTADPYEGEALTEGLGTIVEAVAMPPEVESCVAAFVAAFHVERPFIKRERDAADPDALGHRSSSRGRRGQFA